MHQTSKVFNTPSQFMPANQVGENDFTDVKIKRAVLYALAAIAAFGAFLACVTMGPVGLAIAIPLAGVAVGLVYSANCLKDYDDPVELAEMQEAAKTRNFLDLYKEYGMPNLRRYILSDEEVTKKFHEQVQTMRFCEIFYSFELADLTPITTPKHIQLLYNLKETRENFRAGRCSERHYDSQMAEYDKFKTTLVAQ